MSTRESPGREYKVALLAGAIFTLFAIALLRLMVLQLGQSQSFRDLADNNSIRLKVTPAPRGEMYDRKGRILADSHAYFAITVDPHRPAFERQPQLLRLTLARLAPLLGIPDSILMNAVMAHRLKSMTPLRVANDVDLALLARIEEHRDELPGVEVETLPIRHYPFGSLAGHVLGYSSEISEQELAGRAGEYEPGDLIGHTGLESYYEPWLRGRDGESLVEVNAAGRIVGEIHDRPRRPPEPGRSLWLTIDLDVQRQAELALQKWDCGAVVALDPATGAILAMASRPIYDPNEFSHGITAARWKEIAESKTFPLLNRTLQSAYPPGSTFKIVTAAAGLREAKITPESHMPVSCGGSYTFGRTVFHCWQHAGHGSLALADAISHSCDVYFYQLGLRLGVDPLMHEARCFGLGQKTGVDLPGERTGFVPSTAWLDKRFGKRGWTKAAAINYGIGQGELLVTPLQLAMLAAQVGNGGHVIQPYLVESIRDLDRRVIQAHRARARDVDTGLTPEQLQMLRDAMEMVVMAPGGTGASARISGLTVAGKTGTAQNPHGKDHAVFMAYAPADHPTIAVGVVVENGGHGGTAAAPIAKRLIEAYLAPSQLKPEELVPADSAAARADSNVTD